ncbi:MAG: AAA family ATPase [Formivibrio sp.]|nr:AAA family ATPase [Formivibrio sp.]
MRRILNFVNQLLPLIFLLMACTALVEFSLQHGPNLETMMHFFHRFAWALAVLAGIFWMIVIAGVVHEKRPKIAHSPISSSSKGTLLMDILDRLTNREVLENRLAKKTPAVVIDAGKLAADLKSKVIGQDSVCDDIAAQIRRRLALTQRDKPVGVFMLAGPPGTGKTYLGKRLASALQRKLLHFDMTQYSAGAHSATQLFGAAKGYVGSDSYGKLTGGLRDTPNAIVLLDEIEKAHPEVHKKFLTAWNDGFITEASDGSQISTNQAIFLLTTNAATDTLQTLSITYTNNPDELRRSSVQALREARFAPEVLNRLDRIFVFKPLSGLDVARVTALEIEAMVNGYGLNISIGGVAVDVLLDLMERQEKLGASASARDLVRSIEDTIADTLITAKLQGHTMVELVWESGAVAARPVSSSEESITASSQKTQANVRT